MRLVGSLMLLLMMLPDISRATQATGLYAAAVPVVSRDDKTRVADLRRALTLVMDRIVSPEDLAGKPVNGILDRAVDLVDQYEYRSASDGPDRPAQAMLEVSFDSQRVDEALARARVGVWGENRPELVVWLVVADETSRHFVGAEDGGALISALQKAADKHRIDVILPLLDLTDQQGLTPDDIESGNLTRIRGAAWRYETEVALVGVLVPSGDFQWESHWRFVGPGQAGEWKLGPQSSDEALATAVGGAFGRLVHLYAPVGQGNASLDLPVDGILTMSDGERCGNYLRTLPAVRNVQWASADASIVSWRLNLATSAEAFRQILSDSRRLRPQAGSTRIYQWVP